MGFWTAFFLSVIRVDLLYLHFRHQVIEIMNLRSKFKVCSLLDLKMHKPIWWLPENLLKICILFIVEFSTAQVGWDSPLVSCFLGLVLGLPNHYSFSNL